MYEGEGTIVPNLTTRNGNPLQNEKPGEKGETKTPFSTFFIRKPRNHSDIVLGAISVYRRHTHMLTKRCFRFHCNREKNCIVLTRILDERLLDQLARARHWRFPKCVFKPHRARTPSFFLTVHRSTSSNIQSERERANPPSLFSESGRGEAAAAAAGGGKTALLAVWFYNLRSTLAHSHSFTKPQVFAIVDRGGLLLPFPLSSPLPVLNGVMRPLERRRDETRAKMGF